MKAELLVVGAGPAGCAAAVAAGESGVRVLLLDELEAPGSHTFRSPFAGQVVQAAERELAGLILKLSHPKIDLQTRTTVWGAEAQRLLVRSDRGAESVEFEQLIVATGAREFIRPFVGWDLPGVISLGGLQMLLKSKAVPKSERIVVAGGSPLVLKVAWEAVRYGVKLLQVDLAGSPGGLLSTALRPGVFPGKMAEALGFLSGLVKAGVRIRLNRVVVEAAGSGHLLTVTLGPASSSPPVSVSERLELQLDLLAVGDGFVPNIELTELLGCAQHFDPALGGWAVEVDSRMQTSVSGVYAAGEAAGVAGAACALVEGEIAGLAAAQKLGRISTTAFEARSGDLMKRRKRERSIGRAMAGLGGFKRNRSSGLHPDLTVCRCEGVVWAEVQQAVAAGVQNMDELKNWLRIGQGFCQGRTCGPVLAELLSDELDRSPEELGRLRPRPPIKPLPVADLAGGRIEI